VPRCCCCTPVPAAILNKRIAPAVCDTRRLPATRAAAAPLAPWPIRSRPLPPTRRSGLTVKAASANIPSIASQHIDGDSNE